MTICSNKVKTLENNYNNLQQRFVEGLFETDGFLAIVKAFERKQTNFENILEEISTQNIWLKNDWRLWL